MSRRWLPWALFALIVAVFGAWQIREAPAHEERGVVQERVDYAPPPLNPDSTLTQTLYCSRDGLQGIDLMAVRYRPDESIPDSALCTLSLSPSDAPDEAVIVQQCPADWSHNQIVRFAFDPVPDSAGRQYALSLSCDGDYGLSFWATSADSYAYGCLCEDGAEMDGDLYMVSYHAYRPGDVLEEARRWLGRRMWPILMLALLLTLPGLALVSMLCPRAHGRVMWELTPGLSLASWPLLLLWLSVVGLPLTQAATGAVLVASVILLAYRFWRDPDLVRDLVQGRRVDPLCLVTMLVVVGCAILTRAIQVRDLVVPAWVDSVHHTLITQAIMEQGGVPRSLAPYLPLDGFHYHFGFHANAATFGLLAGLDSPEAVLIIGQALNVLAVWASNVLARRWTGNRVAGVAAGLVVGALCYMPAYYTSWGRYTQLAGLLLLAPLLVMTSRLFGRDGGDWGTLLTAALLLAGLMLTHYRVLVFYGLYLAGLGAAVLIAKRLRWEWHRLALRGMVVGGIAALAVLPWILRFLLSVFPAMASTYGGWSASEGLASDFPTSLLQVGWTEPLLYIAAAGCIWAWLRGRLEFTLLPVWAGLCLLLANPHLVGLPQLWLIHNSSVVISFWLPVSVLVGWLAGDLVEHAAGLFSLWSDLPERCWRASAYAVLVILALVGSWRMVSIVNPTTMLVTVDDMRAMAWMETNLPEDAYLLVNSRPWQGELRVGSDAGWWATLLTGHRTTMPCVLYGQADPTYRQDVNAFSELVQNAGSVDDLALLEALHRRGVTHVYVGARGGKLMPAELDASINYQLCYGTGPVRVYAFAPGAP